LLVTGCAGPRPLKGGKATTTRNQAGLIQQTVAQGENAQQPTKQDQGDGQGPELHPARSDTHRARPGVRGRTVREVLLQQEALSPQLSAV